MYFPFHWDEEYLKIVLVGKTDSASLEIDEQLLWGLLPILELGPVVDSGVAIVTLGQGEILQGHSLNN